MNGRIRFISVIVIFVASIVVLRLYFIQIVHSAEFTADAERQYINKNTILYDRGEIYFEGNNGERVLGAISRSGFTIAINSKILKDVESVYNTLNDIVPINKEHFLSKANKKDDEYEEIITHINSDTAEKIRKLNIYGITLEADKWRFYPGGSLASQTIGFVGYKDNELSGRYGLERYYEDNLKKNPEGAYSNFFAEFFSNVKNTLSDNPKQSGNIITTIEPSTQLFLENELKSVMSTWNSDASG